MREFFENKIAFAATLLAFAGAIGVTAVYGNAPSLPSHVPAFADSIGADSTQPVSLAPQPPVAPLSRPERPRIRPSVFPHPPPPPPRSTLRLPRPIRGIPRRPRRGQIPP